MEIDIELLKSRIINFDLKNHPAWDDKKEFDIRIKDLPLYFLVFNHHEKDKLTQSVTVTHYVPCRSEITALSEIIKAYNPKYSICDIGCGNGFLGSLLARENLNIFGIDNRSYNQPQF